MTHPTRPFPDSYWVAAGQFLAGEYPGSIEPPKARDKVRRLLDCGVDRVIDLTEEGEHGLKPYVGLLREEAARLGRDVRHVRLPVTDASVPPPDLVRRAIGMIDDEIAAGHVAYVHCFGGIGRTGVLVGCWMVEHGRSGTGALAEIAALRRDTPDGYRIAPETEAQREFVRTWRPRPIPGADKSVSTLERFQGCLLGGAVGDALGAPVEFQSLASIRRRYGQDGIRAFAPAFGKDGAITDDTQMTLFTAEGLIRAHNRTGDRVEGQAAISVHSAYLRWLRTQGMHAGAGPALRNPDGWLWTLDELHAARAPGNTCLQALSSGRMGTPEAAINNSKGCGGVMRAAPAGLAAADGESFRLGCEIAAITHGHPSGYLAAGVLTSVIDGIIRGRPLRDAIGDAVRELRGHPGHAECLDAVERAVALAERGDPTAEAVETLGGGWVAEEALAISLYCALVARDFEHGVVLAVNHSGDSDSTGAITGNILGAMLGVDAIPAAWNGVELRNEILELATDLHAHFAPGHPFTGSPEDRTRYPAD